MNCVKVMVAQWEASWMEVAVCGKVRSKLPFSFHPRQKIWYWTRFLHERKAIPVSRYHSHMIVRTNCGISTGNSCKCLYCAEQKTLIQNSRNAALQCPDSIICPIDKNERLSLTKGGHSNHLFCEATNTFVIFTNKTIDVCYLGLVDL